MKKLPMRLYKLQTLQGPVKISRPFPGDQLAIDYLEPDDAEGNRTTSILMVPIIGWARGIDNVLSIYTPGPDSSHFRLANEDGCIEECFFGGKVPATLYEHRLDEYDLGTLKYLPASFDNLTIISEDTPTPAAASGFPVMRLAA